MAQLDNAARRRLWPVGALFAALAVAATVSDGAGRYVADNRFEQYFNPARTLAKMFSVWDGSRGLGGPREDVWLGTTVPVALICTAPNVMVASPGSKVTTVAEFVAYAKANAGKVNYASGGIGSSSHLSAELFKSLAGVEMTHIPYKGASPAVAAVLADDVNVMIGNLPPWSAQIKAGKVRALAVTTATRHPSLPDVPALAESLPGFETVAWFGVLAPTGTPKAAIDRVNTAVNAALGDADVKARLASLGCDPVGTTPEAFAARVNGDVARWKKLATEKQIRAD